MTDIRLFTDDLQHHDWHAILAPYASVVLIADETVAELHLAHLREVIDLAGRDFDLIELTMPCGETHKNRQTKAMLEDALLSKVLGRDTCLIALGGGVVTDLVGFVAATYLRGIDVIYLPTTLMGMLDAAIGGKTAINTSHGKNTLGIIRQPKLVCISTQWLTTLPNDHYRWALAEALKHGLIADKSYWEWLLENNEAILARDPDIVRAMIEKSVAIKTHFVALDSQEKGIRAALNVGHTLGHALEKIHDYQLLHGEAVAWGLRVEAAYAVKIGVLASYVYEEIEQGLKHFGLFSDVKLNVYALMDALSWDKKRQQQRPMMPMLQDIGALAMSEQGCLHPVDMAKLKLVLSDVCEITP